MENSAIDYESRSLQQLSVACAHLLHLYNRLYEFQNTSANDITLTDNNEVIKSLFITKYCC